MKLQPEVSSQPIAAATVAVKAVLPREMSKDDRRLIFAQLNDVYTDAGYSGDWTDQKVATVLGCPRVWVVEVREEFFGTIKDNEQLSAFVKEADDLLKDCHGVLAEAQRLVLAANKTLADVKGLDIRLNAAEKKLADVRRSIGG